MRNVADVAPSTVAGVDSATRVGTDKNCGALHFEKTGRDNVVDRMTTFARWVAIGAILVTTLAPAPAAAQQGRTTFLIERLKYPPKPGGSDDFRVRTNAALALGQSDENEALDPLCRALEIDPSEVVRQAVAAALKRLGRATALQCLRPRQTTETSAAVRLQITRAIEALEARGGQGASASGTDAQAGNEPYKPKFVANAKYYVSISPITNNSERGKDEVQKIVLDAVRSKLEASGQFQVAPENETTAAAKAVMGKRKLKGYYLSLSVDSFDYAGGDLRVRIKCAVFTYPSKDLRGHFTPGAKQQGVRKGDRSSEDNLLSVVSSAAVDQFSQSVEQFAQR